MIATKYVLINSEREARGNSNRLKPLGRLKGFAKEFKRESRLLEKPPYLGAFLRNVGRRAKLAMRPIPIFKPFTWRSLKNRFRPGLVLGRVSGDLPSVLFLFFYFITVSTAWSASSGAAKEANTSQKNEENLKLLMITDEYVHQWRALPEAAGRSLETGEKINVRSTPEHALVLFFVASWCLTCEDLLPQMRAIQKKFSTIHADTYFVFSHDTFDEAKAFAQKYDILSRSVLADHNTIKEYHNPTLPSYYLADRRGWMAARKIDLKKEDLSMLRKNLMMLTAY